MGAGFILDKIPMLPGHYSKWMDTRLPLRWTWERGNEDSTLSPRKPLYEKRFDLFLGHPQGNLRSMSL